MKWFPAYQKKTQALSTSKVQRERRNEYSAVGRRRAASGHTAAKMNRRPSPQSLSEMHRPLCSRQHCGSKRAHKRAVITRGNLQSCGRAGFAGLGDDSVGCGGTVGTCVALASHGAAKRLRRGRSARVGSTFLSHIHGIVFLLWLFQSSPSVV